MGGDDDAKVKAAATYNAAADRYDVRASGIASVQANVMYAVATKP